MNRLKIKKALKDVVLNLFASFLPVFSLQYLIQPYISKIIGINNYGQLLTILSYSNICIGMFGSPLNNTRLLENRKYNEKRGDFNLLVSVSLIICVFLEVLFSECYQIDFDFFSFSFLILFCLFSIISAYLSVEFRLFLSYKKVLLSQIFKSLGYFVGLGCFLLSKRWELVFFTGSLFELTYVVSHTKIWKEGFYVTNNIKLCSKRYLILVASTALSLIVTYADRLIIYPAFGSDEVSMYYAATIIGKSVLLVMNPIGGVFLSYVAKMDEIKKKDYSLLVLSVFLFGFVFYFISNSISGFVVQLLYPNCYPKALQYSPITNATAMLSLFYTLCWPIVFRFGKKTYPFIISSIRIFSYLLFTVLGMKTMGVYSVCYGNLLSTVLQSLIVIILGFRLCSSAGKPQKPLSNEND